MQNKNTARLKKENLKALEIKLPRGWLKKRMILSEEDRRQLGRLRDWEQHSREAAIFARPVKSFPTVTA